MAGIMRSAALAALSLLAGCTQYDTGWFGRPSLARTGDYYARADLDELLRFGADLARKSGSARAEECRRLLKRQRETPGVGVQLHLMSGRLLSESCGDARRIVDAVNSIPAGSLPDARVQWLVAAQTATLKRLGGTSKRIAAAERLERKQKQRAPEAQRAPDSPRVPESQKDEARVLREKLEAIRSIERKLDEATDDAEAK